LNCADIDTLILCGGLGIRLRAAVPDRPKALAEINGRAFLDVLVDELVRSGLRRLVLCTGYGGDQIAAHFRDRSDAEVVVSAEDRPLGTGGAVMHALPSTRSDPFLVVNGDSFCRVSYADLIQFHQRRKALLTIVVTPPSGRGDAGAIQAVEEGRIVEFAEKPASNVRQDRQVNAGIYVMQRAAVDMAPGAAAFSLERDLFPVAVRSGRCFAFEVSGPLTDIGTPERLESARGQIF
jgi:D-glycero-alpha-D-manno-heptose 1-phosphate guanylyltransferase